MIQFVLEFPEAHSLSYSHPDQDVRRLNSYRTGGSGKVGSDRSGVRALALLERGHHSIPGRQKGQACSASG